MMSFPLLSALRAPLLSAGVFAKFVGCLILGFLFLMPVEHACGAAEFQDDGVIVVDGYRARFTRQGVIRLTEPEGIVHDLFVPFDGRPKSIELQVDKASKTATSVVRMAPADGAPYEWHYAMTLTAGGRIRVSLDYQAGESSRKIPSSTGRLHVSRDAVVGGVVTAGEESFTIVAAPPVEERVILRSGSPAVPVVLNAGDPNRRMVFHPMLSGAVVVSDHNTVTYRAPFFELVFQTTEGRLTYEIELPKRAPVRVSSETYAGIDFWQTGRLRMPQYRLSRNLIQNPGFEGGFSYWRWNTLGKVDQDTRYADYYAVTEQDAQEGQRSLALRAERGMNAAEVATFAIPVEVGGEYTLSFYARGEQAKQSLSVSAQGRWAPKTFPVWTKVAISPEWKRYTFTFKAPHPVLSIGFGNHSPAQDNWAFVDSVQLEKGPKATEFTTKAVFAWLEGGDRARMWQPGDSPNASLRLTGKPGAAGQARLRQTDFFGKETDRGTVAFKLDAEGAATVPLPWAAELPLGLHVIAIDVTTSDGFTGTDYDRLTVMRFLSNGHEHKNIFCAHLGTRWPEWDRELEFMKRVGIGSAIIPDPGPHSYHAMMEKHGILSFSSIFENGGQGFKAVGWDQHTHKFNAINPELLKGIEEEAYKRAKAYPDLKYWKALNEPTTPPYIDNPEGMKNVNAVVRAARKGLLRANPDAIMIGSDPANMYAKSGVAFVNTHLEVLGDEKLFEIAAIHPYRARPESPDLDAETRLFLSMLDRHNFKGDVWFTEGIYHSNYIVPAWDLNVHSGCTTDHWRAGAVSYGLGWGERMAAAYVARSWLVALKFADRIKLYVDWGFRINALLDVNLTPGATVFASNTLGNILGNATFKQDLSLGYEVRCYVFEDEQKRPVAAIWYHNLDSDKGNIDGVDLDVSALARAFPGLRYADLMGVSHALPERLRIGPFPVFVQGEAGSTSAFTDRLAQGHLVDDKGDLFAFVQVRADKTLELTVENTLTRPFKGTAVVRDGSRTVYSGALAISPKGKWTHVITGAAGNAKHGETTVHVEVVSEGKTEPRKFELSAAWMEWPKRRQDISLTGQRDEWAGAFQKDLVNRIEFGPHGVGPELRAKFKQSPPVWTGVNDLFGRLYATWDETHLYVALAVKDDVLHPNKDSFQAWNGDSVQLYFDAWADAVKTRETGYGPDDQSFQIWPGQPSGTVYRDTAPERQLAFLDAGPVQDARLVVTRSPDGVTFYELALPVAELSPIQLQERVLFGFAALINDHDGDYRKRALTLTPTGTEPFKNPHLYPTVILAP